jgi:tetratricopeptide (TPR) repeat protein
MDGKFMKVAGWKTAQSLAILALAYLLAACGPGNATERLLIAMTDEVRNMCQQAEQLINSRKFREAEQILNRAAGIDPNCAEVHGYLGMAYQNSSRTEKAVEEYQHALQLNPQMTFIKVNLGTCYMNLNRLDQAVPCFQQYLQENPNGPEAAQVRGYLQQVGARHAQNDLRGSVERGQALLNQHKYREATSAFEQAIAQQPNFAPAHFYLGFALGQSGQNQRAIAEFQTSLQLDPGLKDAILNIGSNYQSLGDAANAIGWYERFLRENPGSPKAGDIRQRVNGLRQQLSQQAKQPPPAGAYSMPPGAANAADDYFAGACSGGRCYRWPRMPIRVFVAPGAGVPGFRDSFFQVIHDAFSKWAVASENRLSFTLVQDRAQADIVCEWTSDANRVVEAGRAVEGGLTKLSGQPQANGDVVIVGASITILTNRGGQPLSDDDMKKVCLHEIGHALGINGHSSDNHDIMFFSESPTVWPSLTKRDKATICRLYANYPGLSGGNY